PAPPPRRSPAPCPEPPGTPPPGRPRRCRPPCPRGRRPRSTRRPRPPRGPPARPRRTARPRFPRRWTRDDPGPRRRRSGSLGLTLLTGLVLVHDLGVDHVVVRRGGLALSGGLGALGGSGLVDRLPDRLGLGVEGLHLGLD